LNPKPIDVHGARRVALHEAVEQPEQLLELGQV
jgi:hypothetical protein